MLTKSVNYKITSYKTNYLTFESQTNPASRPVYPYVKYLDTDLAWLEDDQISRAHGLFPVSSTPTSKPPGQSARDAATE